MVLVANGFTVAEKDQLQQHGNGQSQNERDEDYNGQTIEGIDDVEVAEILREAARVDGLDNYDVWFGMIGRPHPRINQPVPDRQLCPTCIFRNLELQSLTQACGAA